MLERKEREYGLPILICVFAIALYMQSNPITKGFLILAIAILFSVTAFINWYIRLSK